MAKKRTIRTIPQERTRPREQDPRERAKNFAEVTWVFSVEDALRESERCLFCPDPACVDGPDFDGHQVDFADLTTRLRRFAVEEKSALERWSESCRMKLPPESPAADPLALPDPFEEVGGG